MIPEKHCTDPGKHDGHEWRDDSEVDYYCDGSALPAGDPLSDELRQESINRLIGLADRLRGMLEAAAEPVMPPRGEHYPVHSRALTRDYHLGWAAYHAQAADDGMRLLGLIDRDTPEGQAGYQDIAHDRQFAVVHQLAALNLGVDRMAVLLEHIAGMHNLSEAQGGPPATEQAATVEHTEQEGGQS